MKQHSIPAYVSLINQLLECEEGSEWLILRDHTDLLDSELLGILEHIVLKFRQQGDLTVSNYLQFLEQLIQREIAIHQSNPDETNRSHLAQFLYTLCHSPDGTENTIALQYQHCFKPKNIEYLNDLCVLCQKHQISPLAQKLERVLRQIEGRRSDQEPQKQDDDSQPLQRDEEKSSLISSPIKPRETSDAANVVMLRKAISDLAEILRQPRRDLGYLETLEKAQANQWLLSTHELMQLLGVKPHCAANQSAYYKGGWKFIKVGKQGRDILWQVQKLTAEAVAEGRSTTIEEMSHEKTMGDDEHLEEILPTVDPWFT